MTATALPRWRGLVSAVAGTSAGPRGVPAMPGSPMAITPCAACIVRFVGACRHTRAMSGEVPPGLREIARCQGGVVSRQQALRTGMTPGAIVAKLKYGRWQPLHRGVYATFTGPLSREARLWAAVLYAGKGARLSHQTAAELHRLTGMPAPLIHLTVPASRRVRPADGLVLHVSALIGERPPGPRGTLPRTPIEATVLDLAQAARGLDEARAWVARACRSGLTSQARLRAAMRARGRLRWRHQLGQIVADPAAGSRRLS